MFRLVKILVSAVVLAGAVASSASAVAGTAPVISPVISPGELEREVESRLMRVDQFKFIREEAAKRGLRVYLFGGTAAGFAHYVKWDLQREKGDSRYQADRFDYDYTNIYRSTQDLDVVVDGDVSLVNELFGVVRSKFPHVQGSKTQWEFRPLRQAIGVAGQPGFKEAILNSADFMNQHTDSNSTGLIEITVPPAGEPLVRDVRDWNSHPSQFLRDAAAGKIRYYFSPTHESTARFKAGDNPALFSALRYMTKAFQYELEMTPEDLARVKRIVLDFDPVKELASPRAYAWLVKNGKKLVQHAVDMEYAFHWIQALGIDTKLGNLDDRRQVESLSWWLHKKPLESRPVGEGTGLTAKQLGVDVVSHETGSMLAFESITRAHTGEPNVLISRRAASGETAAFGDGFYTRIGQEGGRGTGQTIRFALKPDAREGTDFQRAGQDYVVILNKAAIRVIPESLNLSPFEFFEMMAARTAIRDSDLGIMEKAKARMRTKINVLTTPEIAKIDSVVEKALAANVPAEQMYETWFELPSSKANVALAKRLAVSGLVAGRMDKIAPFVSHFDFTLAETLKVAFGPTISPEASIALRRRALAKATSMAEVVSLLRPVRNQFGHFNDQGNFVIDSNGGKEKKKVFTNEELLFVKEAMPTLWQKWARAPDANAIHELIFQLQTKNQWDEVAELLASTAPDKRAGEVVMGELQKMSLQDRGPQRFGKSWAALLLRSNREGWDFAPKLLLLGQLPDVVAEAQLSMAKDSLRAPQFDFATAREVSTPIWRGMSGIEAGYNLKLQKIRAVIESGPTCKMLFTR